MLKKILISALLCCLFFTGSSVSAQNCEVSGVNVFSLNDGSKKSIGDKHLFIWGHKDNDRKQVLIETASGAGCAGEEIFTYLINDKTGGNNPTSQNIIPAVNKKSVSVGDSLSSGVLVNSGEDLCVKETISECISDPDGQLCTYVKYVREQAFAKRSQIDAAGIFPKSSNQTLEDFIGPTVWPAASLQYIEQTSTLEQYYKAIYARPNQFTTIDNYEFLDGDSTRFGKNAFIEAVALEKELLALIGDSPSLIPASDCVVYGAAISAEQLSSPQSYTAGTVTQNINDLKPGVLKKSRPFHYVCHGDCNTTWAVQRVIQDASGGVGINPNNPCLDSNGKLDPNCQELLAPLPGITEGINDGRGYIDVSKLTFGTYINTMLQLVTGLIGIAAVLMLSYAGFMYMSTSAFNKKFDMKKMLFNALISLSLILGIYLILATINPNLLDLNPGIGSVTLDGAAQLNSNGTYTVSRGGSSKPFEINGVAIIDRAVWQDVIDEHSLEDLRPVAENLGFKVNKAECEKVGDSGCTTMHFTPAVFSQLKADLEALQAGCADCADIASNTGGKSWIITGGSEAWLHSTHGPDVAVLDMTAANTALNEYLGGVETFNGNCKKTSPTSGAGFISKVTPEGPGCGTPNHWHIAF